MGVVFFTKYVLKFWDIVKGVPFFVNSLKYFPFVSRRRRRLLPQPPVEVGVRCGQERSGGRSLQAEELRINTSFIFLFLLYLVSKQN